MGVEEMLGRACESFESKLDKQTQRSAELAEELAVNVRKCEAEKLLAHASESFESKLEVQGRHFEEFAEELVANKWKCEFEETLSRACGGVESKLEGQAHRISELAKELASSAQKREAGEQSRCTPANLTQMTATSHRKPPPLPPVPRAHRPKPPALGTIAQPLAQSAAVSSDNSVLVQRKFTLVVFDAWRRQMCDERARKAVIGACAGLHCRSVMVRAFAALIQNLRTVRAASEQCAIPSAQLAAAHRAKSMRDAVLKLRARAVERRRLAQLAAARRTKCMRDVVWKLRRRAVERRRLRQTYVAFRQWLQPARLRYWLDVWHVAAFGESQ